MHGIINDPLNDYNELEVKQSLVYYLNYFVPFVNWAKFFDISYHDHRNKEEPEILKKKIKLPYQNFKNPNFSIRHILDFIIYFKNM